MNRSSSLSMAAGAKKAPGVPIDLFKGSAEEIPLDDKTIDTVVTTWTLCTVPDVKRALSEMQRVLKPTGHVLFVEHGQSPDANVRRWQDRLTPLWRCLAGGCHLNREIAQPKKQTLSKNGTSALNFQCSAFILPIVFAQHLFLGPSQSLNEERSPETV